MNKDDAVSDIQRRLTVPTMIENLCYLDEAIVSCMNSGIRTVEIAQSCEDAINYFDYSVSNLDWFSSASHSVDYYKDVIFNNLLNTDSYDYEGFVDSSSYKKYAIYEELINSCFEDSDSSATISLSDAILSGKFNRKSNTAQKSKPISSIPISNNVVRPTSRSKSSNISQMMESLEWLKSQDDYWIKSVALCNPMIPLFDPTKPVLKFSYDGKEYCICDDIGVPFNQSQITLNTKPSKFSKADILNLYPDKRLYTRPQYMYKKYSGLDYDDDLGTIIKIKGYNKTQLKKNLVEYPHLDLDYIDRRVVINGKDETVPFWEYIEIDGEMHKTVSVWDKLPDTKKLPRTKSFMSEYVIRKYILDTTIGGVEYKYKMRGTLLPFLTLYAPSDYYKAKKYDVDEIGRLCVEARSSFIYSRNPIIHLYETKVLGKADK